MHSLGVLSWGVVLVCSPKADIHGYPALDTALIQDNALKEQGALRSSPNRQKSLLKLKISASRQG
jgi:hypothetical protein